MNKIYRKLYSLVKENPEAVNSLFSQKRKNFHDHRKIHSLEGKLNIQDKFLEMAIHDLRGPINNIEGFVDLLTETNMDEEQKDYTNYVSIGLQALENCVDLINLSEITLKEQQKIAVPINFNEKINNLYKSNLLLKDEGIELKMNDFKERPCLSEPFANSLIANTIGNASKYVPQNNPINVELTIENDDFKYRVSNNLDSGLKRNISGENTGKGLPFMKYIVEQIYQGKLESSGKDGIYTTKISIPYANLQPPKE